MSSLYLPPNKSYPQELPDYWRSEDGTVYTNLQTLTDSELNALGWHGPIQLPNDSDRFSYKYSWNEDTLSFDAIELTDGEKMNNIDINIFKNLLYTGVIMGESGQKTNAIFYNRIKYESTQSLQINTISTELLSYISSISSLNIQDLNFSILQGLLSQLFNLIDFTNEEIQEFAKILSETGFDQFITIQ